MPAKPDSVRERVLDRIDFHPSYDSNYSVNRTSRVWTNSLSFDRKFGLLDLNHSLSLRNNEDKAQNGLRGKAGSMATSLDYSIAGMGGWSFGLDSHVDRSSQSSLVSGQADSKTQLGFKTDTKVLDGALKRAFPALAAFTLSTTSEIGYSLEESSSRRSNNLDSTRVGGTYQTYNVGFGGTVHSIDLKTAFESDRRLGDSHTRSLTRSGGTWVFDNEEKDTSDNRTRNLDGSLTWAPSKTLKSNFTAHAHHEINQYWDPLARNNAGAAESKDGHDNGGGAMLDWTPNEEDTFHAEFDRSTVMANYLVQPRDFSKRDTNTKLEGRLKLPKKVGFLAGTELHSTYSSENTRNEVQQTANYRQKQRTLRNEIRRSLLSKLQLTGTNETSIYQYFYDDHSNDRDELRQLLDGVLIYSPTALWTGTFNATWSGRKAVSIPSDKASNNNTTQSYTVAGEVDYKAGPKSISQKYSIEADYTYFDFNSSNNNLVRSNEVQTSYDDRIGENLSMGLQHIYQFRDSGQYVDSPSGRVYIPSTKETRHQLTLYTSYPIGTLLKIDASQMLDRRRTRAVSTNHITTTLRGEFSLRVSMDTDIEKDFHISANFGKTQSITEKNYWTINAEVRRNF